MVKVNEPTWLPDKKYYEYAYHKFFNPSVEYQTWQPWNEWTYPERDLIRFHHIINQQLDYIQKKRVLDVACHLGYLSLFCLYHGSSFVTGTNIRERELSIAKEINTIAGYNNFNFIDSDIYNIEEFANLCNRHDTVLLSGILYHINHHYQVLKAIAESSADTVIIESCLHNSITLGNSPIINWTFENVFDSVSGYEKNQSTTFVGIPNHQWIEKALLQLKFHIVYNEIFDYKRVDGTVKKKCVIVGKKSNINHAL